MKVAALPGPLQRALNSKEPRGCRDFLAAQGLAPDLGPGSDATLFDTGLVGFARTGVFP